MKDIWDPAELQLYQRHLAALKEAHAQLGATIDTELLTKALVPFQKEMQALGITMAEVTARPREMIEALVDLQKAATDTPEALLVAWQRYKALLEAVGATTTEVGQKQIAVQKDVVTAQQAQLKKAQADFERFQEQVRDKVADVMFDFVSNIGDGATSFKDIWHDALESVKDMFLRTLTEMAARALVEKILIPVGVTTSTGAGGTGGSIDLGALLGLFGGKSTGTTAAPGAAVTPTDCGGGAGGCHGHFRHGRGRGRRGGHRDYGGHGLERSAATSRGRVAHLAGAGGGTRGGGGGRPHWEHRAHYWSRGGRHRGRGHWGSDSARAIVARERPQAARALYRHSDHGAGWHRVCPRLDTSWPFWGGWANGPPG